MQTNVVVGGGSAGAILGARLSEDPTLNVIVLEAGPDYESEDATPRDLLDAKNLGGPTHQWGYLSVPIEGRTMPYPRGKVVGGTGAINAAAILWPRPSDFEAWADIGLSDWAWDKVRSHFTRLEADPNCQGNHHGRTGPIPIERYDRSELIPIQRAFYDGCVAEGFAKVDDQNDLTSSGVGPFPMNRRGDTRISTVFTHLNEARARDNFTLQCNRTVDRLVLDGSRVTGVRLSDGTIQGADVVTLCAGAIGTPCILMRSGIGPAADLEKLGIRVEIDLPGVGARIWDHAAVPIRLVPLEGECVIGRDPRMQIMARFTAPGSSVKDDMQLVMTSHLDLTGAQQLIDEAGVNVVAALRVALMLPNGHGRLTLSGSGVEAPPKIDLNYCSDAEDERRLMEGTRLGWKILSSEPMAGAYVRVAGLSDNIVKDDDALRAYIRANIGTYCHASGTVPIGPEGDELAALDQRCKVRGTSNLFVADASVFPRIPSAIPHLTVMMVAERVASIQKQQADIQS